MDYTNTHRSLVEACQQGSRQAQFELYKLYSKAMFNLCVRMVKDELDAEDVLQNAFVDVFTKIGTFKFESSIGAWVKRIVVNNCINFLKKKRMQFESFEERHTLVAEAEADENHAGLSVEAIKKALFQLPDGYRVVFSLYLLEGYDHQEIGDILGITEATSKSQYSRAKRKIKELLQSPSER
ncbi:MAG: RNA polymerase sigma factor [Haliscomenobacter sp.]|nr:RNA polymerase sigma factor [Haliscomenobacter sp.]MBK8878729.1 RNA polymerase sigma factor [Haliscomenobacter sp.]